MLLRMTNDPTIKNLRNHAPETVEELRGLLNRGATASLDPHRNHFYELDGGSRVFYIFVSPSTGKVTLLAVWESPAARMPARAQGLELATYCSSQG
jgi:hypothetical protein